MNETSAKLSDRAKARLRIAAGFLRSLGIKLSMPRDRFYDEIQVQLNELPPEKKEWLRSMVDWVEEYDRAAAQMSNSAKSKK